MEPQKTEGKVTSTDSPQDSRQNIIVVFALLFLVAVGGFAFAAFSPVIIEGEQDACSATTKLGRRLQQADAERALQLLGGNARALVVAADEVERLNKRQEVLRTIFGEFFHVSPDSMIELNAEYFAARQFAGTPASFRCARLYWYVRSI